MFKLTAYLLCNNDEKVKVTMFCDLLNITYKELPTEDQAFGAYQIKGKKIDVLTFFHQAGRQLKTVIPTSHIPTHKN